MNIEPLRYREQNPFIRSYISHDEKVASFFSYEPYKWESLEKRASSLDQHDRFNRKELLRVLTSYNVSIDNHDFAFKQIAKLEDPTSKVVIGGQQAGVLTGPMLAIYKAIHIIKMAKEAETRLGTPVIPVYWIAGEDHDWDEVNHVTQFTSDNAIKQYKFQHDPIGRNSISHISISSKELKQFIDTVSMTWNQTEHKEGLKEDLYQLAEKSTTLTQFFARTMVYLFGEYGLVLIDSADDAFRKLEQPYFVDVIDRNAELHHALLETENHFKMAGFTPQIEIEENQAHLFIYIEGERTLLVRDRECFVSKNGNYRFTKDELLHIAKTDPARLSPNVVFRSIMQESIFPTLVFIGGTSEVSYWGLYKEMLSVLGLELPVIIPRIGFTLVDGTSQKLMKKYSLTYEDVIYNVIDKREQWYHQQDQLHLSDKFTLVKERIRDEYILLQQTLIEINKGMSELGETNLAKVLSELEYLEKKANIANRLKFEVGLGHFDRLANLQAPNHKLQERVFHPFYFLNEYGRSWIKELIDNDLISNQQHYIIHL